MLEFIRSRLNSFRNAFSGWWYVIRTQQNAWIHALVSILVILCGFWVGLGGYDWVMIILAIALVWTAEFLNTALEAVVDLSSPPIHPLAKIGKDVGAAAVMIAAVASIAIGILVLLPKLWMKISAFFGQ